MPNRPNDFYLARSSYFYDLPENQIAQHPAERRDASRLLVCADQAAPVDRHFSDLPEYLQKGDVLVLNQSRVLPARLHAKSDNPARSAETEFLLLKQAAQPDTWECLARPGKHAKVGDRFTVADKLTLTVVEVLADGNRIVSFDYDHQSPFLRILDEVGEMPLPPYIHERASDPDRYQTVYAKVPGSAAAPTAGFHFTQELLQTLQSRGVILCPVVLHIGLGTFRPVKEDNILDHKMHTETYEISQESAEIVNAAKREGRRVIAVGTTSCRTLEGAFDRETNTLPARHGSTDLFIYPGYRFSVIDGLITNFHLPESTLLMLVCAFYGYDAVMDAYRHAVEQGYRFFSFGDACLFL